MYPKRVPAKHGPQCELKTNIKSDIQLIKQHILNMQSICKIDDNLNIKCIQYTCIMSAHVFNNIIHVFRKYTCI